VGPFNFFDARAARLNQAVFDLVRLGNLHSATENVNAAMQSARDARDLVVLAVGGSYLQIIATRARIAAAQAQVDTSRAIFEPATDRLNAGLNPRIDATRSQVQLQTDQERLRSLQADLDRQKLNLARVIGLPRGQQFNVTDTFPYAALRMSVDEALRNAYQSRADLKAADASVRAAQAVVKAAHAERLPNLPDGRLRGCRPEAGPRGSRSVYGLRGPDNPVI
jgi:outer membrane protein TolC